MEIKSDNPTHSSGTPTYNRLDFIHTIVASIISIVLIGMSTNQIPENILVVVGILLLNLVLYNIIKTYQTLELAQRIENEGIGYLLSKNPITGPIGIMFTITVLLFLVTGNLFAWQLYLVYIVVATIIDKSHRARLGVIPKEKK